MNKYLLVFFLAVPLNLAFAEFEVFTDDQVYSDGQPLLVYGTALPGENLILRLKAPDGSFAKFDQIDVDSEDGTFFHVLLVWPKASTNFPYGTYTIEVISSQNPDIAESIEVKFTSSSDLVDVPVERQINTLVFVPETAAVNVPLRVFVQTTSDGLLIAGSPEKLLQTTHVHLPDGTVENLSDSFKTLHQGLYYADYTPNLVGTYVFHVVTFYQGTVSHGSAATNVMS